MTKENFVKEYAERSGLSVEILHALGQIAVKCDCEYEGCEGWTMVSKELYDNNNLK